MGARVRREKSLDKVDESVKSRPLRRKDRFVNLKDYPSVVQISNLIFLNYTSDIT